MSFGWGRAADPLERLGSGPPARRLAMKLKRILAALFGAFLFALLVPLVGALQGWVPFDGLAGLLSLIVVGAVSGALAGYRWPTVFGFVFELFLEFDA